MKLCNVFSPGVTNNHPWCELHRVSYAKSDDNFFLIFFLLKDQKKKIIVKKKKKWKRNTHTQEIFKSLVAISNILVHEKEFFKKSLICGAESGIFLGVGIKLIPQ